MKRNKLIIDKFRGSMKQKDYIKRMELENAKKV